MSTLKQLIDEELERRVALNSSQIEKALEGPERDATFEDAYAKAMQATGEKRA